MAGVQERTAISFPKIVLDVAEGDASVRATLRLAYKLIHEQPRTRESLRRLHGVVSENREILLVQFPGYRSVFDALRHATPDEEPYMEPSKKESRFRFGPEGEIIWKESSPMGKLDEGKEKPVTKKTIVQKKKRPPRPQSERRESTRRRKEKRVREIDLTKVQPGEITVNTFIRNYGLPEYEAVRMLGIAALGGRINNRKLPQGRAYSEREAVELFEAYKSWTTAFDAQPSVGIRVNKEETYEIEGQRYALASYFSEKHHINPSNVPFLLSGIPTKKGTRRDGNDARLFSISDAMPRIEALNELPFLVQGTKSYIDTYGRTWMTMGAIEKHVPMWKNRLISAAVSLPYFDVRLDSGSKPLYIADHVKKEAMGERFEDPRWLQTIDQAKFNNAVRYLRIDLGLSRDEFSKLANISCDSLKQIELGKAPASLRVVNRIIQRARLDVDGKAAQLLRLKSQGESPMTIAELATVAPEKLFFYLTIAKGEVQNETAAALERGKGTIYKFAKGQLSLKGTLGKIPEWLGVSTESSLYRLFEQRVLTPNIPANRELVDGVLSEGFVFVDPTRKMPRYRTEVDNILIKELQEKDTVGQALRHLRTRKGLTQPALAGNDHTKSYVGSKEVGPNLPFDYKAGDILKKAGYDIHHPVAHYMINRLSDLRAA